MEPVESKSSNQKSKSSAGKSKSQGNYIDTFVKQIFGRVLVFTDFLVHYADKKFVAEIDLAKIQPVLSHYIGQKGDERIVDLVFQCPLKSGTGNLMAVIIFEHQSTNLKTIPEKLLRYISAIWNAERKEKKKSLSAPYFIVLRTGKKPYRGRYPTMLDALPKGQDGKPVGKVVEVEYDVVDLPALDCDALTGGVILRLALGMLHKMTGDSLDEFPAALLPLLEISDEGQRIELTKELLDFVDKALKAHNRRLDEAMVHNALKPIFSKKEQTMIKSIFDEKVDEGIVIGEAKGKRDAVLAVLRARFKRVPAEVEESILAMNDSVSLESLAVHAATCSSMNEFAETLQ